MRTDQGRVWRQGAGEISGETAPTDAARKRAAVELISRDERTLKRTARRYSVCEDDAEDAYQRALEILLTKAPTADPRQLIKWMQTVTKHEALAIRRQRERLLGRPPGGTDETSGDWMELLPHRGDGPADLAERHEQVARCREAFQALKPQELRALTLLGEGFSYAEIGERTGWTYTKINRALAEGRQRFRLLLSSSESGERCAQLEPRLSPFCDGETDAEDTKAVREHLRVCAHCRSTVRAFKVAPRAAAAFAPALPLSRSLLERAHDGAVAFHGRITGRLNDSAIGQLTTGGGPRGGGITALAKVLAVCAGTAGGAAACVATGVVPPLELAQSEKQKPVIVEKGPQRVTEAPVVIPDPVPPEQAPAPVPEPDPAPSRQSAPEPRTPDRTPPSAPAPSAEFTPEAAPGPSPAPAPAPAASPSSSSTSSSSGAGEFGP